MELTFNKVGNDWVAEFDVSSNFNIHIEKGYGALTVSQTTVPGGKPDTTKSLFMSANDAVLDTDVFGADIFPKYITIKAETKDAPYTVVTFPSDVQTAIDESIVANLNTPV